MKIPIVSAYIKVITHTGIPVLLKIHEAAYIKDSPITLLSEYQVREHGLVIDSVAQKHRTINNKYGTQQLYLNDVLRIPFVDQGGLMGFEILPYVDGDEARMEVHTITQNTPWKPGGGLQM